MKPAGTDLKSSCAVSVTRLSPLLKAAAESLPLTGVWKTGTVEGLFVGWSNVDDGATLVVVRLGGDGLGKDHTCVPCDGGSVEGLLGNLNIVDDGATLAVAKVAGDDLGKDHGSVARDGGCIGAAATHGISVPSSRSCPQRETTT